ncbi:NYN domain-containing protein [Microbispora sp. KK1-11]|uniref:NYN domain-containing protein n=1 Tax=Microbispora sp. KK1-11 TaxID=2053005 RepID=UPI00115B643E|nr:NYN domain-containing protein [Microbispora sp. KK1-11]TQS27230.1 NYN domain-containing protein [Microbispora sp. KK1-11]
MDRCALFVDAGYLLADGAMAVHGTRHREAVSWDYPGLLQLLTNLSRERTGLPLLRCYWYEATVEGRRTPEHDVLADIPGLKLRLGRIRPGRREGVDAQVHRDLMTLARNNAVCDAVVVSGDEDLAQVVSDAQDLGIRVTVMQIAADGAWSAARTLRQECDDLVEIASGHLRPYVTMLTGADPGPGLGNGQSHGNGLVPHGNGSLSNGTHLTGSHQNGTQPNGSQPNGSHQNSGQSQGSHAAGLHGGATPVTGSHGTPSQSASHDPGAFGAASNVTQPHATGIPGTGTHSGGSHGTSTQGTGTQGSGTQGSGPHANGTQGSGAQEGGAHGTGAHGTGAHSGGRSSAAHARPALPAQPSPPVYNAYSPESPQPPVQPSQQQRQAQPPGSTPLPAPPASTPPSPPSGVQTPPSSPVQSQYGSGSAAGYSPSQLGPYTGPQPAPVPVHTGGTTTLAEAVKAAHKEGHDFGESVARDAPALWLEAVLARKPRMPSDLEARLLQGSSLPIDFLLHDEVRHALRRGFWDALERARR